MNSFQKRLIRFNKVAFNKENPTELLSQIIAVLNKAAQKAAGSGKKGLTDASSRVKGLTSIVQDAWNHRNDE